MRGGATLDKVLYPVGSIYMSVDSTNPSELFGGVWEQVSGYFLYCTNTSKTTGGDTTTGSHTLTVDEIPSHRHSFATVSSIQLPLTTYDMASGFNTQNYGIGTAYTNYTGGGIGHTHPQSLPPYFTVYCWYRVS